MSQVKTEPQQQVVIRPLYVERWHGNNTNENAHDAGTTVVALRDPVTDNYALSFTEEEKASIKESLGVEIDTIYSVSEPHPLWTLNRRTRLSLSGRGATTLNFNPEKPNYEFLQYKVALGSKFIANSLTEYQEGKWPEATHYIVETEEEVKAKASRLEKKQQAYSYLASMDRAKKLQMLVVVAGLDFSHATDAKINAEISDIVENKTNEFIRYCNSTDKEVAILATVKKAVDKSLLIKKSDGIYFGDLNLGMTEIETSETLADAKHQKILLNIEAQLEAE